MGTVYYGGESIQLEIGKEYHFQMCSNDWDTDRYTDEGDGICGYGRVHRAGVRPL